MITIALFGAAGKMGTRITNNLRDDQEYRLLYVEADKSGEARLRERELTPTCKEAAVRGSDVIVLAVPDALIGSVAADIVPSLKSGAMMISLDPAAPHGGELPKREDISYFVTHPCHPPVVSDETDPEARMDFFGGVKAKQNIVCALMQGSEEDYARGEAIARRMFAPVMRTHRITVEQMAILEPAMAETVVLTCMSVIREAMDEVIRRGVPPEAAHDFLMGHMNVTIGILFGFIDAEVSDGARLMMERARQRIFQPDWKKVFEPESILEEIKAITHGASS
ncbi:phosphogluconate dehydrogenase C-terminal domain-containing protein [Candidatus Poribacteria bacterium]